MKYFTADLHIGHANIIELCSRPFRSIGEMNNRIMVNWNQKVTNDDTVYIMGDMFFGKHPNVLEYVSYLNGKKYLTPGNHDDWMEHNEDALCLFEEIALMMEVPYTEKRQLTLCHYPMMCWNEDRRGHGYMIHGHIHNRSNEVFFEYIRQNPNILNAGVDINNFEPVTFEELVCNNAKFKKK